MREEYLPAKQSLSDKMQLYDVLSTSNAADRLDTAIQMLMATNATNNGGYSILSRHPKQVADLLLRAMPLHLQMLYEKASVGE